MNTTEKSSSIAWRPTGDAAPKQPEVASYALMSLLSRTWNVSGMGKHHSDRKFLSGEIKSRSQSSGSKQSFKRKQWLDLKPPVFRQQGLNPPMRRRYGSNDSAEVPRG